MSDIPDDVVLPCGCLIRCAVSSFVRTLTIYPCRQSCPNLAATLDIAGEKGITPEYRVDS